MNIDSKLLSLQLSYTFAASRRTLAALRSLSEEQLRENRRSSHGGILDTLLHIFYGDRVWFSRVAGHPRTALADPGEAWSLDSLDAAWQRLAEQWRQWAAGVQNASEVLHYCDLAGREHSLELWQVVFHLVNHGTYHRGQIAAMLRQAGHPPIATDLHNYYLEM